MELYPVKFTLQILLTVLILLFFGNGDACLSQSSWNVFSPNAAPQPHKEPIMKLDRETTSILQQTFLKVILERGKLDFSCPSEKGLFPDPLDCKKYYNCTDFNYTTVICGNEMGFEPLAKSCVRDESVPLCQRVQKLTGFMCNDTGLKFYENNCDKFILCTKEGSEAFVSTCNPGDKFDQKLLLCLPEKEANCSQPVNN